MASSGRDIPPPSPVRAWSRVVPAAALAAAVVVGLRAVVVPAPEAGAIDAQSMLAVAPHGTPFSFEVVESHDAKYPGDTPSHTGRDGGLTVRPQVALGDAVYRTVGTATKVVGSITQVAWDRVSGGLTVEFDPRPQERIAVGDEVWIDLNPAAASPRAAAESTPPASPP